MAECRHGFEEGLCDICSPRPTAEPTRPAPRRSAPQRTSLRSTPAPAASLRSTPAAPREQPAEPARDIPLARRRIYHVTHRANLEAILADGEIRADAAPAIALLAPEARERRSSVEVVPGTALEEFVHFSLSPTAAWWSEVRRGALDPRWSAVAQSESYTDYVVLIGTVEAAGSEIVVSDVDASSPLARFAVGTEAGGALLRRASLHDPELLRPEVLVRGSYPLDRVVSIAHPHEPARKRVKTMLSEAGVAEPRLAVFPPYFARVEDEEI